MEIGLPKEVVPRDERRSSAHVAALQPAPAPTSLGQTQR